MVAEFKCLISSNPEQGCRENAFGKLHFRPRGSEDLEKEYWPCHFYGSVY